MTMEDLYLSILESKPSVSKNELEVYEKFSNEFCLNWLHKKSFTSYTSLRDRTRGQITAAKRAGLHIEIIQGSRDSFP